MDKQIEKAAFAAIPFKGLVGRKIVTVRYCTTDELNNWGWSSNPLILELDDGTVFDTSEVIQRAMMVER